MEPKTYKMDDFLKEGQETLKELKNTASVLKWLYGVILVIILAMYTDTRIAVVNKADASEVKLFREEVSTFKEEVKKGFLTRQDALTLVSTIEINTKYMINKHNAGDSLIASCSEYKWIVDKLFNN